MSYQTLFRQYGRDTDEGRVNISGYLLRPEKLTADRIKNYDAVAADIIKEATEVIDALTEYRQALATRYAYLDTSPYKLRLELERCPEGWQKPKIYYYIRIVRTYEDGTMEKELAETYEGKDRRIALARFEELKKQRPGIENVTDIEKRHWER